MADYRITLNHRAMEDLLKSEEVIKVLRDIAEDVVAATGMPETEYEIEEWVGQNRARVSVKTNGSAAHAREARDHNLVQALGSVQSSG